MPIPCKNLKYISRQLTKNTYTRLTLCNKKVVEAKTLKYKRQNKYVLVNLTNHKEIRWESDKERLQKWKRNHISINYWKNYKIFEVK